MLVVGLIGQIGSGKSTAGEFFKALGVPVIDTDRLAFDAIMQPEIKEKVIAHFGHAILRADGELDRPQLKSLIFADSGLRHWLEQLLHPWIEQKLIQQLQQLDAPYAVVLLPLLLDRKRLTYIDRLLVIDTSCELQQQRVLKRDSIDQQLLQQIRAAQASTQQLHAVADDILSNNADLSDLQQRIFVYHQKYIRMTFTQET